MDSDESFHKRLMALQPEAFETLVTRYEGSIYRMFLCDHRNHHLAQEQTAETFAQLVRSIPTMRGGPEKIRAFVFGVARNVQLRRWRTRRLAQLPMELAKDVSDMKPSSMEQASAREQVERLMGVLSQLEQPLRSVLLLRFVEECTLDEIVETLGMPLGTVKSHIHRGRARLKATLKDQEVENESS